MDMTETDSEVDLFRMTEFVYFLHETFNAEYPTSFLRCGEVYHLVTSIALDHMLFDWAAVDGIVTPNYPYLLTQTEKDTIIGYLNI